MLTLKSLKFSGIGRFVEEQTINFDQLGFLVQVDGQNNNTNGSSGAGKSTIFKSLEFLLGLNDISNGVLQSRLTKDPMSVTGLFELDGLPLKIERSKKLLIDLNGDIITGSSVLSEEKLDQILGMPRDLFRKILHKRQNEGGFFLQMTPSLIHKFLTSCLGLEKEQAKIPVLDDKLECLLEDESTLKSSLESNQMGLQATKDAIASLGLHPVLDVDPKVTEELKTAYTIATEDLSRSKESLDREMKEFEKSRPQISTIPFDRSKIEEIEKEIGTILAQISELEKNEQNRQLEVKSQISELQVLSGKLVNSELSRQSDIKNQISSIRVEISDIQKAEQNRQSEVKSSISALEIELINTQSSINRGNEAKDQAILLVKELQSVRNSVCPTCEQGWINDTCKAKEAEILVKLSEYKKLVVAGNEATNKYSLISEQLQALKLEAQPKSDPTISELQEKALKLQIEAKPQTVPEVVEISYKIEHLKQDAQPKEIPEVTELKLNSDSRYSVLSILRQEEKDHQAKENSRQEAILKEYSYKHSELRVSHRYCLEQLQDRVNNLQSDLNSAENKIKNFEESKKKYDLSFNKINERSKTYGSELKSKTESLSLVREEIELAENAKKAIKSYLSCSFEDALDSIGEVATKLLRSIPNMSTATIQFDGLKETKEGKIKEEVTCVVSMDGEIGISVKSLSGGERSSTDLAIDLSVIKFIEERTGKGINLMILDEPFTGLDSKNILEALEMLKECSLDKRLVIVDHNEVASQAIENKLLVIRDGLTSRIVQQ